FGIPESWRECKDCRWGNWPESRKGQRQAHYCPLAEAANNCRCNAVGLECVGKVVRDSWQLVPEFVAERVEVGEGIHFLEDRKIAGKPGKAGIAQENWSVDAESSPLPAKLFRNRNKVVAVCTPSMEEDQC